MTIRDGERRKRLLHCTLSPSLSKVQLTFGCYVSTLFALPACTLRLITSSKLFHHATYLPHCASDSAFADIVRVYKFHLLTYLLRAFIDTESGHDTRGIQRLETSHLQTVNHDSRRPTTQLCYEYQMIFGHTLQLSETNFEFVHRVGRRLTSPRLRHRYVTIRN